MINPEDLQYVLGIHPDQMAASQALMQGAQGDSSALTDTGQDQPPPPEPRPVLRGQEEKQEEESGDSKPLFSASRSNEPRLTNVEPVSIPPRESVIKKPQQEMGPEISPEMAAKNDTPSLSVPGEQSNSGDKEDMSSVSDLMRTPIRPISEREQQMQELRAREGKDRTEMNRIQDTGSGIHQFQQHHRFLGPLVRSLEIAGSVMAPGVMAQIPGTTIHHNIDLERARGRVESDIGDETKHEAINSREDVDEARKETAAARDEANRIRRTGMEEKFIAGSEHEDPNSPTGWSAQNFRGEWKPFQPKAERNTKAEDFQQVQQQREKEANRMNLKGKDREMYVANGKLSDPAMHVHVPSAEADEFAQWKAAYRQENGHDPDTAAIEAYKHGNKSTKPKDMRTAFSGVEKDKQVGLTAEANRFKKEWNQAYKDSDGKPDQATLDNLNAEHKAHMDSIQLSYEQRITELGGKGESEQKPANGPTKPGQDVGGGFKYAQQVMVDNKPAYITGYNPQKKKPRVSFSLPQ